MYTLQFLIPLDPIAALDPLLAYVILVIAVINVFTRVIQHRHHVEQSTESSDDGTLARWLPHTATTVSLVLLSFVYMIPNPHGGMVMSTFALGVFFTDFFEFESRLVEARSRSKSISRPKAAIGASLFAVIYAAYQSLFFLVEPLWNSLV
jgi:hypothetical protein